MKRAFIAITITLCLVIGLQGFYVYRQHSEIQTLTIEHARLQERYASLQADFTILQEKYLGLQKEHKSLEQAYASLESDHKKLQGDYASLEKRYGTLELEYSTLSDKFRKLEGDYASLESKYTLLSRDYDVLKSQYSSLESKHIALQTEYNKLLSMYNSLESRYSSLQSEYNALQLSYQNLKSQYDVIFTKVSSGYVASTIVYYTDYGNEQRIVTIFIERNTFKYYKEKYHAPYTSDPASYVTSTETVIVSIVKTVKGYTQGEEELADALLSFVQYQQISLSIRYYTPESRIFGESKYPIETLVEMGGDCKGHTILYASLLRAAGYKVIILITSDHTHTLVGVHLTNPPTHGTQKSYWYMTYKEERYYMAETTAYGWMVGDCPTDLQTQTFYIYAVD